MLPMEEQLDQSAPPTNENLNAYLDDFYREEQERLVHFPESLPAQATPSMCSSSMSAPWPGMMWRRAA